MISTAFTRAVERRKLEFWRALNAEGVYLHEVDVTERPRSLIIQTDRASMAKAHAIAGKLALSHNYTNDGKAVVVRF